MLALDLMLDWPHHTITGHARYTQVVSPPMIETESMVHGRFAELALPMDRKSPMAMVTVSLLGFPSDQFVPGHENLRLLMALDQSWQHGVAEYQHLCPDGTWMTIVAPAESISANMEEMGNPGA